MTPDQKAEVGSSGSLGSPEPTESIRFVTQNGTKQNNVRLNEKNELNKSSECINLIKL